MPYPTKSRLTTEQMQLLKQQGKTYQEIAELAGVRTPSVYQRLRRLKKEKTMQQPKRKHLTEQKFNSIKRVTEGMTKAHVIRTVKLVGYSEATAYRIFSSDSWEAYKDLVTVHGKGREVKQVVEAELESKLALELTDATGIPNLLREQNDILRQLLEVWQEKPKKGLFR